MIRSWTVLTLVVACGLVLAGCTSDGTDVSPSTSATADGAGVSPATSATALPVGAYVPVGSPGDDSRDGYVLNLGPDGDFFNLMDRNTLRLTPKGVDSCEERARMCSGGFRLFMRDMDFEYEANFGEEFTLGDGIWVTVGEPVQFTPSEEVSAMPFWGPLALEDWDQFVRATVTWRNEFGGGGPNGVGR